ncbi:LuxR family transcriptional regulator (plasmid) [Agrobacterium sp. rho-13.3]|uniref:LuxR family transcriptional regulator n=1 Tax=Agrobacterium sp. rho-13.3 TaxID=3072980 RepID=UPI002A0ADAEF|nr:LuxR family transcriptional regulator [Agrobacterium sp. rho-13.3]MDX8310128.1 LuxR family transcriptional regulator [Agrobacterium sp. rho-13.3]
MKNRLASSLSSSLSTLDAVESDADLPSAIADIRERYKFAHLVFLVVRPPSPPEISPLYWTTYPREWTDLYVENNYVEIDPVLPIWRTGFLPVDWSDLDWKSIATRELLREASRFGVGRHGVTVPVRGPNGERSLLSATANSSRHEWRKLRASSDHDLQILSLYLHEKVAAVSGLRKHGAHRTLSKREQECLQLVATGLVPKQIASNLEVSESAVRLYLGLARRKLQAATIYEAIAKASFHEKIQT